MRKYNLNEEAKKLYNPNIINLVTKIYEYKGKQDLYIESEKDVLTSLLNVAKIHSTEYSNKIEGIHTTNERIKELVNEKVKPKTRNEAEIAGYRDVLKTIHENYEYIPLSKNILLQLHRDLYKYTSYGSAGKLKTEDNAIEETKENGEKVIRFKPVSAFETLLSIEELCNSYNEEIKRGEIEPLILIPIFILDFLSIHPFMDGNGRMSRLLTLLLLYQNGYIVGKYISIEKLIENTKDSYYDSLGSSSVLWHENQNDYSFFVEYYLGVILRVYKDFSNRVEYVSNKKLLVKERVLIVIEKSVSSVTKKEITEICPDISEGAIERALNELVNEKSILKIGGGRFTSYVINKSE